MNWVGLALAFYGGIGVGMIVGVEIVIHEFRKPRDDERRQTLR